MWWVHPIFPVSCRRQDFTARTAYSGHKIPRALLYTRAQCSIVLVVAHSIIIQLHTNGCSENAWHSCETLNVNQYCGYVGRADWVIEYGNFKEIVCGVDDEPRLRNCDTLEEFAKLGQWPLLFSTIEDTAKNCNPLNEDEKRYQSVFDAVSVTITKRSQNCSQYMCDFVLFQPLCTSERHIVQRTVNW